MFKLIDVFSKLIKKKNASGVFLLEKFNILNPRPIVQNVGHASKNDNYQDSGINTHKLRGRRILDLLSFLNIGLYATINKNVL